jgi:hypothetical protein
MGKKGVDKADKRGVDVARALRSKRKKDIIRVFVVLGIVRMFRIARNLGSLRMSGFDRCTGGGKYKVS